MTATTLRGALHARHARDVEGTTRMSNSVDDERSECDFDARLERAKQVLRDLQSVLAAHTNRESVSETARRLKTDRPRVHWMQRVLGLRSGRIKSGRLTTRVGPVSIGMEVG